MVSFSPSLSPIYIPSLPPLSSSLPVFLHHLFYFFFRYSPTISTLSLLNLSFIHAIHRPPIIQPSPSPLHPRHIPRPSTSHLLSSCVLTSSLLLLASPLPHRSPRPLPPSSRRDGLPAVTILVSGCRRRFICGVCQSSNKMKELASLTIINSHLSHRKNNHILGCSSVGFVSHSALGSLAGFLILFLPFNCQNVTSECTF